jgi:apolipoprotein N-acyltransferase
MIAGAAVLVLAASAGAAITLAMAPFNLWWLAVLSPAVLFALLATCRRRLGLWAAYVYGVGYFGVGGHWIYFSVGQYGAGAGPALLFCLLLALLFGVLIWACGLLWHLLAGRGASRVWALWVVLPACWILIEWVRSWLLTGTTWLQLGYSQLDGWLAGYAPLVGALGISAMLAVLAGGVGAALVAGRRAVTTGMPVWLAWSAPPLLGVGLALGGAALERWDWTEPAGARLSAALLQGNVPQDQKWQWEHRAEHINRYLIMSRAHWGVDLVIWPETAIPAYHHQVQRSLLDPLRQESAQAGSAVLVGVPSMDAERLRAFNSLFLLGGGDEVYHKRHLVPFGEYVPLRRQLGPLLDVFGAPLGDFTAGSQATLLSVAGAVLAPTICYEVSMPHLVRDFLPAATVLVNVSNDAWFGDSIGPAQHYQIAAMRALEMGRPLLRATNDGITAAVDHRGRELARLPRFVTDALVVTVEPRQGLTPYARHGDQPLLWVLAGVLLVALGLRAHARAGVRRR